MQKLRIAIIVLSGLLTLTCAWGQNGARDKNPAVVSSEKPTYPPLAKTARIQGLVVVQAKLDESGHVTDATALSGDAMLVSDTLANVKKWRFSPNGQSTAIVVYDFRVEDPCYEFGFVVKGNHAILNVDAPILESH